MTFHQVYAIRSSSPLEGLSASLRLLKYFWIMFILIQTLLTVQILKNGGLTVKNFADMNTGDTIVAYEEEEVKRTL